MEPDARTPGDFPLDPALIKRFRWLLIALGVLAVAVLAFFLLSAFKEEKADARWDKLAEIQERFEPELGQDPLFEDPSGLYTQRRDRYIAELQRFLPDAAAVDDALVPHVHYLLAQLATDQFYAAQDPVEAEARKRYHDLAKTHWEILRDDFPDFQGNWLQFAPPGHGSVTRMVLSVLEANESWAETHFPRAKEPSQDAVVVFRTERGDLHLGLYAEDAPELTRRFLERVLRGEYDGTYFFAKTDQGTDEDPVRRTIRGGHTGVRDVLAYDAGAVGTFATEPAGEALLPSPSRYRIAAAPGVVAAWHDPADPYDGSAQFLVTIARSPQLDHQYSPIGSLIDEPSRATASRIFEGETWGDRADDSPPSNLEDIRKFLRAPVRIVKALAYRDGRLVHPEGPALPSKAPADTSEETLANLVRDAHRTEAPAEPRLPDAAPEPLDDDAEDQPER